MMLMSGRTEASGKPKGILKMKIAPVEPRGILHSAKVFGITEWTEAVGPSLVRRVGHGKPCDKDDSFRLYVCARDSTTLEIPVRYRCDEYKACPKCSLRWAYLEGRKAAWRMFHVGRLLRRRRRWTKVWLPRHVTLSLDQWQFRQPRNLQEAFTAAWRLLKGLGVYAGLQMYHPARNGEERGPQGQVYWIPGPHVHVICWGPMEAEPLEAARAAGWVVKTIREVKHGEDMRQLIGYLGTHAGYEPRKHSVRWYGWASYARCRGVPRLPAATREELAPCCPVCGDVMLLVMEVDWTGRLGEGVSWRPS